MLPAVLAEPMADDSQREFALLGNRMNHEKSTDAEGAGRAGEIVDIKAGDRRSYDTPSAIEHRMVDERDEELGHL